MRAFVLVMWHSGLRIGDTIALDDSRISDNKLLLYTAKTGTPVYVPLPPIVVRALASIPRHVRRGAAAEGVSLENVSGLLGHSSIKVTERHYAPWVKARQTILEAEVRRTWDGSEGQGESDTPRTSVEGPAYVVDVVRH